MVLEELDMENFHKQLILEGVDSIDPMKRIHNNRVLKPNTHAVAWWECQGHVLCIPEIGA